jgi:hypothetical protein
MNDTLNANALLDRVDAAMRLIEITRRERDEARRRIAQLLLEREEAIQQSMRDARRADASAALCSKLRDIAERAIDLALAYYDGPCERDGAKLRAELDQLKSGK